MPKTVEELEAENAELRGERDGAKARIAELNNESKGHRLNAENARKDAQKAADDLKSAYEALEKAQGLGAAAEAKAAEKVKAAEDNAAELSKAAEDKASSAITAAQQRAVNADLKIAAKDAGAHDAASVLALLPRDKIKLDKDGEIENAAELIADMKKEKPFLFGTGLTNTSNPTNPPPKPQNQQKTAKEMSPEEWKAARARLQRGESV